MALVSPGVEVSVIDESTYSSSAASTVPLVVVATASNKTTPSGSVATGTLAANAGDLYILTSQRDVVNFFGTPSFYTDTNNNPIHGYELNEYGLQTVYSLLGTTSRAYVLRADIDLGQLVGLSSRPQADPADMTYWLNIKETNFGVFEWSSTTQKFTTAAIIKIDSADDLDGGVPKDSVGTIGSYAIVGTNRSLPLYKKDNTNTWVLVGSTAWMNSTPTIIAGNVSPTVTAAESITINASTVTLTGTTITQVAADINALAITGVTASVYQNRLQLFADATAASTGGTADGAIQIANDSGTPLTDLGINAGKYHRPAVQQSAHTSVPEWKSTDTAPRPAGSIWVKTTAANGGASFDLRRYDALKGVWSKVTAPIYENDQSAIFALDKTGGGKNIGISSTYIQYDVSENDTVTYKVFDRAASGTTTVTGSVEGATFTAAETFTISASAAGVATLTSPVTVTLSGTTPAEFVADVLAANVSNVSASVGPDSEIRITHDQGGVIVLKDTSGTPLADAGITSSSVYARAGNNSDIIVSNWEVTAPTVLDTTPGVDPSAGTKWYWGEVGEVDIMVHDGTNWKGYQNVTSDSRGYNLSNTDPAGPIVSPSEPTQQSDKSALAYGDIWVDSSDLENYPKLYRYESTDKWVELSNADQTTENGVLFADARFMGNGTDDVNDIRIPSIKSLLTNDYLDLDAPNPSLYPRGMLLINTRRSSFNVKEFRVNHFNSTTFAGEVLPTETNAWVSVSGTRENGHAYFGRKAQRSIISAAMKSAIDTNTDIREEQREYNLIASPGYPELIPNMVQLNNDRRQTAFVVGDSPMRIASEGTELLNYLSNTDLNGTDGEASLVTSDPYVGVWYPSVLGNDLNGNSVALPASYSVLRMMIRNDQVGFPWFAPAGTRRGSIDNASRLGYLNSSNEFVSIGVREGVRDTLYENRVNPLIQTPQAGIVAFGQKTRAAGTSALDRVNVARLTAYMRNQLDKTARNFLFEPNDTITRNEIKGAIEALCNDLVAKRALFDYLVVCDESNNTPERIDRNELYLDIAIEPVKSVEFIYIPLRIKSTGEIAAGN
jgi:phage tail sheath protein FI